MGSLTPMQSAQLAKARGIPIYTIGAGKDGLVPFPIFDDKGKKVSYSWVEADLDEDALKDIASTTGGRFFRAADTGTIESAFSAIDSSQKIEFQAKSYLLTIRTLSLASRSRAGPLLRRRMALETPMSFAWPHLLWLLALPAGLLVWELMRARRRSGSEHPKIIRAEAGLRSVSLSPEGSRGPALSRRRFLMCAGLALGIVALARPQWGRLDEPVFDQSREIIIALDLSRSMLTPDVKPSRLERSKLLIESLLDRLRGERVGLIAFSGTAFLQAPLSADYEIMKEFLPSLGPDFLPEGGTNYRQLIDTAVEAFGDSSSADRYLIILSDGEATDEDWRERVPELSKRGSA
jgi:hypothetical protein